MLAHVCNSLGSRLRRPGCYRLLCNTALTARLSRSFCYRAYAPFFSVSRGGPRAGRSGPCALPLRFDVVSQGAWLLLAQALGLLPPVLLAKPYTYSNKVRTIDGRQLRFLLKFDDFPLGLVFTMFLPCFYVFNGPPPSQATRRGGGGKKGLARLRRASPVPRPQDPLATPPCRSRPPWYLFAAMPSAETSIRDLFVG
jgi:hypothetical protein